MIVCVPTEGDGGIDGSVAGQFGQAVTFTLFDTSTNGIRVIPNRGGPDGANGTTSRYLPEEKFEAVLAGKLGNDAMADFRKKGIWVYLGARGTVLDAITSWRNGRLQRATVDTAHEDHQH